jgi:hypothetical protein
MWFVTGLTLSVRIVFPPFTVTLVDGRRSEFEELMETTKLVAGVSRSEMVNAIGAIGAFWTAVRSGIGEIVGG